MLKKLTPPFVLLLLTSTAGYAAQESSLSDDIVNQALSCADLVDKIRDSDCIAPVADFLKGGNLSLGATMGAFSVNLKVKNEKTVVGKMGGENSWAPHYSINTRPRHFDGSNFGYDYSFTYEQSATTSQVITRGGKDKAIDLGTYAIGSIIATQVNLFYSIGANDDSPAKYFTLAIGVGLGYGSVKGNTYLTEDETNTVCYDAATKYHEGTGSIEAVSQSCKKTAYDLWGLGGSGRVMINYRNNAYNFRFELTNVNLGAAAKLVTGKSDYDLSPSSFSFTAAYLFDVF